MRTLLENAVDACFMNPGTSEMQFVSALDRVEGMRGLLCLYEGVCSGAADGYARMTGRPAATLLHLGPGLANALANFHNARKARSPVVNIVGEHATHHQAYDAPLTADIGAFARTVSGWVRVLEHAAGMGTAAAAAVRAALEPPGQVATLIVPADFSWSAAGEPGGKVERPARRPPPAERVERVARILAAGGPAAGILLSGMGLAASAIERAGRIAAATGARIFANRYAARMARGRGRFAPLRVPYFPEAAEQALEGLEHLVLVETQPPVSFFGYPGRESTITPPGCEFVELTSGEESSEAALEMLEEACGVPARGGVPPAAPLAGLGELPGPDAPLTADAIGRVVAHWLPEDAVVSDEMVSSGEAVGAYLGGAAPHDLLPVTGGSIGQGLPVALGAAVAAPHRKVVALEADGSAMYTLAALWTMARERLDVAVVILNNRRYRILDLEMARTGAGRVGPRADAMFDLGRPNLDWVRLGEGHGVEAVRVWEAGAFGAEFARAMREPGPRLIEAVMP